MDPTPDRPAPNIVRTYLKFETPIAELERKVQELRALEGSDTAVSISDEIKKLEQKAHAALAETYAKLTPWQKTEVARHPERPHCLDYVSGLIEDFTPLAGDRYFGEDEAIVGGIGTFRGRSVMVIGHEKGSDTESRLRHNFGMAKPDGYRKAQRLMKLAEHFNLPIITFVDTAGAFPGVDAEARGQAEAIAKSIEVCLSVNVPFITVVIGEGGSGGAIALATADRVLMLEHAIYSVISPEGCAGILWRSNTFAATAAEALRLTAQDLNTLGVIDEIVPEPVGGAHRDKDVMMQRVGERIAHHLRDIAGQAARTGGNYLNTRAEKFLAMGQRGL